MASSSTTVGDNYPAKIKRYLKHIWEASKKAHVPSDMIAAVIWQESRGNPNVVTKNPVNGEDDGGLMQINALTFQDQKGKHKDIPQHQPITDPETNILAGAYYLGELLKMFGGDIEWTLRAYNSGPAAAEKLKNEGRSPHNGPNGTDANYVKNVQHIWNALRTGEDLPA